MKFPPAAQAEMQRFAKGGGKAAPFKKKHKAKKRKRKGKTQANGEPWRPGYSGGKRTDGSKY